MKGLKFKCSDLPQKWASVAPSTVIHHKAQTQEAQTSICTISFWDESELIQSYCSSSKKWKELNISQYKVLNISCSESVLCDLRTFIIFPLVLIFIKSWDVMKNSKCFSLWPCGDWDLHLVGIRSTVFVFRTLLTVSPAHHPAIATGNKQILITLMKKEIITKNTPSARQRWQRTPLASLPTD